MNYLKIFSPATVANVSCGFDSLGFAVDAVGDEMTFTKTAEKGVKITEITGANLPYDIDKNAAGAVVQKMLLEANADFGISMTIHKGFSPGSGLGSSAASAAGGASGRRRHAALRHRGYDYRFEFGPGAHDLKHGAAVFPATLRWLWR